MNSNCIIVPFMFHALLSGDCELDVDHNPGPGGANMSIVDSKFTRFGKKKGYAVEKEKYCC